MTHTTTITPQAASEAGALDGFRVDCEECGFVGSSSNESTARTMYAEGHRRYMGESDPFAGIVDVIHNDPWDA